jgi:cytochrome oxidase Cu insertion factor (SCO1/SenC/PrrC family)
METNETGRSCCDSGVPADGVSELEERRPDYVRERGLARHANDVLPDGLRPYFPLATDGIFQKARRTYSFKLSDQEGREVTKESIAGSPTLVIFGYTKCEERCPMVAAQVAEIVRQVPIKVLWGSVDPDETQEALIEWSRRFGFISTRGDSGTLMLGLRQQHGSKKTMGDHPATIFLLDAQANFAGQWLYPAESGRVVADLKMYAERA